MYKQLYKHSNGSKELFVSILENAKENKLIDRTHVLIADMAVDIHETWTRAFEQLRPMVNDIYTIAYLCLNLASKLRKERE